VARRRVAAWYHESLGDVSGIVLPEVPPHAEHVYHLYVIRTPAREELREHLQAEGIGTGLHYPVPLHLQKPYASLGYRSGSLPVTERAAAQCLSLPMFPEMTQPQVRRVADAVRRFF